MRLRGYEFVPQADFQDKLLSHGSSMFHSASLDSILTSPAPALPVYVDESGGEFVAGMMGEQMSPIPFLSGSPTIPSAEAGGLTDVFTGGGFVPVDAMPPAQFGGMDDEMMAGIAKNVSPANATQWLGAAVKNSMLGGAPGQAQDRALAALGIQNPLRQGGIGEAIKATAEQLKSGEAPSGGGPLKRPGMAGGGWAGGETSTASDSAQGPSGPGGSAKRAPQGGGEPGPSSGNDGFDWTSMLPAAGQLLAGSSSSGVGASMGNAAMQQAFQAAGLDFPGSSTAASVLGGALGTALGDQVGGLMNDLGLGGLAGGVTDNIPPGATPGIVPGAFDGEGGAAQNIVPGGCMPGKDGGAAVDVNKLGADALESAADELLGEWKVDDESSAAETVANKIVNDNKDQIKEAVKDPDGFLEKIKGYFSGAAAGTGEWAVRIGDLDNKGDASAMGIPNILFQGQPVSRITDLVVGPQAPPPGVIISQGKTQVLSAGLPTAFKTAKTWVVSDMVTGAPTILVGGANSTLDPPPPPPEPKTESNQAPTNPDAPPTTESGSKPPEKPQGDQDEAPKDDEGKTPVDRDDEPKPDEEATPEPVGEEKDHGIGAKDVAKKVPKGVKYGTSDALDRMDAADAAQVRDGQLVAGRDRAMAAADDYKAKATEARANSSDLSAKAQQADAAVGGRPQGTGANETYDAIKAGQEAENLKVKAQGQANAADVFDAKAAKFEKAGEALEAARPDIPNSLDPELKGTVKGGKNIAGKLGAGMMVVEAGKGIYDMSQIPAGEDRDILRQAGRTSGSLIGGTAGASVGAGLAAGLAVATVATGGVALVVVGAGAIAGGVIGGWFGGAAGEAGGDMLADATGYENASGNRKPTQVEGWFDSWW